MTPGELRAVLNGVSDVGTVYAEVVADNQTALTNTLYCEVVAGGIKIGIDCAGLNLTDPDPNGLTDQSESDE